MYPFCPHMWRSCLLSKPKIGDKSMTTFFTLAFNCSSLSPSWRLAKTSMSNLVFGNSSSGGNPPSSSLIKALVALSKSARWTRCLSWILKSCTLADLFKAALRWCLRAAALTVLNSRLKPWAISIKFLKASCTQHERDNQQALLWCFLLQC